MTKLATCLCAAIEAGDGPGVCWCGIVGGAANEPPAYLVGESDNDDECGAAYVQMALAYPSDSLGVLTSVPASQPTGTSIDLHIGILRSIDLAETIPTEADMLAVATQQHADMTLIKKAVVCCEQPGIAKHDMVLGAYLPHGPLGGVYGGHWTVHYGVL